MYLYEDTKKIVCHFEKMFGFGMMFHMDRIGTYDLDGTVKRSLNNPEKYDYIQNPELRIWNRGEGPKAEDVKDEWEKIVSTLSRRPQPGKLQEDRGGYIKGDVVLTTTIEYIISAGKIFWRELRKMYPKDEDYYIQCEKYFEEARRAIKELYPDAIIIKWTSHYEEESPHMHLHLVPILKSPKRCKKEETEDKRKMRAIGDKINEAKEREDKEAEKKARYELSMLQEEIKARNDKKEKVLRYTVAEFFGGPEGGVRLQNKMAEVLCVNWDVERGDYNSDARHTGYIEHKNNLLQESKKLNKEYEIFYEQKKKFQNEKEKFLNEKKEIETEKENLDIEKVELKIKQDEVEESQKKLNQQLEISNKTASDIKNMENKRTDDEKFILRAKHMDLEKAEIPEPNKNEKAISFYERIKVWFRGILLRNKDIKKELDDKEKQLNMEKIRVETQLGRLVGDYGEENKLKQAIILLQKKLEDFNKNGKAAPINSHKNDINKNKKKSSRFGK